MWGQEVDWEINPNTDWYTKNPVATEFSISTAADLAGLAELVNEGVNGGNPVDFTGKTITLTANITLNEKVLGDGGTLVGNAGALKSWTPIGNYNYPFTGTFDGNNKTVSGVYIDNSKMYVELGLFGYLGENGVIKNVEVEDSYVKGMGQSASVGGVCGDSGGSIANSYNAGSVIGTGTYADVGGVCGENGESAEITGCYYLQVDGVPSTGIGKDNRENEGEDGTTGPGLEGFVFAVNNGLVQGLSTPWIGEATANGNNITFPTLAQVPEQGEGGVYLISTAKELRWFAWAVNIGNAMINGKLMEDIAVSGYTLDGTAPELKDHWTPIGKDDEKPFTGTFDGNGKKVSGVYIDDNTPKAHLGLFGYLGERGVIKNVGVVDIM